MFGLSLALAIAASNLTPAFGEEPPDLPDLDPPPPRAPPPDCKWCDAGPVAKAERHTGPRSRVATRLVNTGIVASSLGVATVAGTLVWAKAGLPGITGHEGIVVPLFTFGAGSFVAVSSLPLILVGELLPRTTGQDGDGDEADGRPDSGARVTARLGVTPGGLTLAGTF